MNFIKQAITAAVCCLSLVGTIQAQSETITTKNSIQAINATQQGGDVIVKLEFKDAITAPPVGFSISNPARVALDFSNTSNDLARSLQAINQGDLSSVNIVQVGDRTRMVFNLVRPMKYETRTEGNNLFVTLKSQADSSVAEAKTRFAEESLIGRKHSITDIAFRRGKDGEARILVDLSDSGTGIDIRQQGTSLVVDFLKTTLPDNLRRKLDVSDFATPVTTVATSSQGDNVRMLISPKGLWEHNAYQTDNQFVIEVKPIIENPNKLVQGSKIGYQGPRVSINYQNGDVRALLRLMAEELGLNAVISETVTGTTTLVLKDVPADQVIDIIFQQKGLDMRKNGNVILIAPRDELSTREKLEYEARQQIGDLEPTKSEIFQINYHKADDIFKFLSDKAQTMLSKRGSVVVDSRTNKLFITDIPSRLEGVRAILKEIDLPARQVLIEARIVEAGDSFAKNIGFRLGISSGGVAKDGSDSTRVGFGGDYQNVGQYNGLVKGDALYPQLHQVNLPAAPRSGTAGALSFVLYNAARSRFLSMEISALEADGRGKVISSPRVMTANQIEALIEQGVEIPYQQATSSGATSVSFRKANLALKVKPQITPDGKVILTLDVNKDTPNPTLQTGSGVAIDTKHVKTEVLVENGGTVVIGGIYTQNIKNQTQKIPVLGDIPYLGWMFKNTENIDDKTELLIFVTPRIVSENLSVN
ncbi:MAG: type IV pilus secretin PilQ [Betaproteobacteria bacterium]